MTIQEGNTEGSPVNKESNQEQAPQLSKEQPVDAKKIAVDLAPGVSVELDIDTAKKVIAHRDSRTKGFKELESKLKSAEDAAKNESERAKLLESIKNQNIEAIEEQVSSKYKETISKFEKKVFEGDIKSNLSKLGLIPEALEDATKLVLSDAKVTLEGDDIKINGIKSDEFLKTWASTKPHLVLSKGATPTGAKQGPNKVPSIKANVDPFSSLTKGIRNFK